MTEMVATLLNIRSWSLEPFLIWSDKTMLLQSRLWFQANDQKCMLKPCLTLCMFYSTGCPVYSDSDTPEDGLQVRL